LIGAIEDNLKRDFYAEMTRIQRWSVRTKQKQLDSMLYERTALSKRPECVM
jgi:predicted nuclease of restriction endonuclease-like (RecB) superfamily